MSHFSPSKDTELSFDTCCSLTHVLFLKRLDIPTGKGPHLHSACYGSHVVCFPGLHVGNSVVVLKCERWCDSKKWSPVGSPQTFEDLCVEGSSCLPSGFSPKPPLTSCFKIWSLTTTAACTSTTELPAGDWARRTFRALRLQAEETSSQTIACLGYFVIAMELN